MSDTTCGQFHQRPITSASNYISVQLQPHLLYPYIECARECQWGLTLDFCDINAKLLQ